MRRHRPSIEGLEPRALPSGAPLVLLCDLDTGAIPIPSFAGSGYPLPLTPLGDYIAGEMNFLTPAPTGTWGVDLGGGYGGHGSICAAEYAVSMLDLFHVQPHVVPLIVADGGGYHTGAIAEAMQWVAQQQAMFRAQGRDVRLIVTVPAGIEATMGVPEVFARQALDRAGIPIVHAAGDNGWDISHFAFAFDRSPTGIVAAAGDPSGQLWPESNHAAFTVTACVPEAFSTSGATLLTAAWITADVLAHPEWPATWVAYDVSHRGALPGP